MFREIAVRRIKPLLSDSAWQKLRKVDPKAGERDAVEAAKKARAAKTARLSRPADADLSSKSLTELAQHFGTDKWGRLHRYTPHYERHLAHLKNEKFTLIEIGIGGYSRAKQGGASLRMWKAYFPHAQVIGLDIQDKAFVNEDRITAYRGSQTDASLLQRLAFGADNLQVVIDDGSHHNDHVITTFGILFPMLPVGGHYVIEDTQTAFWPRVGGSRDLNDPTTSMGFTKTLVDGLNYEEYTDAGYEPTFNELHVVGVHTYHNIVFVDKGINADGRSTMSHD